MRKNKPAVFLDRDGTILTERGYLSDPAAMIFYPGVFAALKSLRKAGFKLVVVTNQSGVARGYLSLSTLRKINREFTRVMRSRGVKIDGIYFCPHGPDAGCRCRKPKPLMAQKAARALGLDLGRSFVVGDQTRDVQLARNIGAQGVLVLTGAGRSVRAKARSVASKVTRNLSTAARWILSHSAIAIK